MVSNALFKEKKNSSEPRFHLLLSSYPSFLPCIPIAPPQLHDRYPLFRTQLLLNLGLEILGLLGACPAALDLAVATDEELFKVPLDALEAHDTGLLVLEPLEGGFGVGAVDLFDSN